jgi:uncharacterized membrane protein
MHKKVFLLVLAFVLLFSMSNYAFAFDEWWSTEWNYRVKFSINVSAYNRTEWPMEIPVNITRYFNNTNLSFNMNSTRVFEYYENGSIMQEVRSQFDPDDYYNISTNAFGTLVFFMNGTTMPNTTRIFYFYFDANENGVKNATSYYTNISYESDGQKISVNNTMLRMNIDTNRKDNTSGLYHVEDRYNNVIIDAVDSDRTAEYVEYYNGTGNTTYNLINNITFINGSLRLTIKQTGNEVLLGDISKETNETRLIKKYYIYGKAGREYKGTIIKIYQKIENIANHSVQRNSTAAGALAFDINRTFGSMIGIEDFLGNSINPFSYYQAGSSGYVVGIVNINSSQNFNATNTSERIGIQLKNTTIPVNGSITETAMVYFGTGGSEGASEFLYLRNTFISPENITEFPAENWHVYIESSTNFTTYNRNETFYIYGNISSGDPNNLTRYMNATIDMGTPSTADDVTIVLYDDDTHGDASAWDMTYTDYFGISNNATLGIWRINLTVYNGTYALLGYNETTFNVTDVLNVSTQITNPGGLVNRIIYGNVYVTNFRKDEWISGASVNCSHGSTPVNNITDLNNGTYSFNFTAPSSEGEYILFCNATKNGNYGNDTDTFLTEPEKSYVKITPEAQNVTIYNITIYNNKTFSVVLNISNPENGTAYSTNVTPELLSGWTSNSTITFCGNIAKESYCIRSFDITVPNNTSPNNYYINFTVRWTNPDNTVNLNKTTINVSVSSNPSINVTQTNITKTARDGMQTYVGNFTIVSYGNAPLQNITFNCTSGTVCQNFTVTFTPPNLSILNVDQNYSVSVNVTIPIAFAPGIYNGTVNVSANSTYDTFYLFIILQNTTTIGIDTSVTTQVDNVTMYDNQTFEFYVNITNMGNSSARYLNFTLTSPSGWSVNSSFELCENITSGSKCQRFFNVTVANGTLYGTHRINITANWTELNGSFGTKISYYNVSILHNPVLNITETNVTANVSMGENKNVGNITILSFGNVPLQNTTFNCTSGTVCQNFSVTFTPSVVSSIPLGQNYTVAINVTVPSNLESGTYNGTINISGYDSNNKYLTIIITVPSNRTWTMLPTSCIRSEYPDYGTVCTAMVMNTGNTAIDFNITPSSGNYTWVNETNFTINILGNHTFTVFYNVSNVTQATYNMTYTVQPTEEASPNYMHLNVSLRPYVPPIVILNVSTSLMEQDGGVDIYANITDIANSGISGVIAKVTRPDNVTDIKNLTLLNQNGNQSRWFISYNNSWGNTNLRGKYQMMILAEDTIGNIGNNTHNFTVYLKISTTLTTMASSYLQGDTGSIYFSTKNNGTGIENVNATFTIKNSGQNVTYYSAFTTNADGVIYPLPTFALSSDSPIGNYTLYSNYTYYDPIANYTIRNQTNYSFLVKSRTITVTGLFADLETAVVWYPDNIMNFGILVYNGEGRPVDPDDIVLTVYDPAQHTYFSKNISDMKKETVGYYRYNYSMHSNTSSGMYLALVNVTQDEFNTMKLKAFRVARGGPYDFIISLLKNEVQPGSYLDFTLTIENKGEVTQDVFLEYWITSPQGNTYFSTSEYVLTSALSTQNFTRSAYIYSNQSLGTYFINARITYDYIQPYLQVNKAFLVIAKNITQPPQPPGGVGGGAVEGEGIGILPITGEFAKEAPERNGSVIIIEKYNSNVSLAKGAIRIENVIVRNVGQLVLENLTLMIVGIDQMWYNITPSNYTNAQPENSYIFLIEYNVPSTAKEGEYKGTLIANTNKGSDRKPLTINVYKSIEEIISIEIERLKEELQNLVIDTKVAEKEGKDVSAINIILDEIRNQISQAEENYDKGRLEDAMNNIGNGKNLVERAKDLLSKLQVPKKAEEGIPLWIIILIIAAASGAIVFVLIRKKKIAIKQPRILDFIKAMRAGPEINKEELLKEQDKLTRMLNILEQEKGEGIISNDAYNEMKKSIDEKMENLNKKLSQAK